jgi:hypothetical protein
VFSVRSAQESGQDDPDVLFLYGKALFQVAQQNSQVLGGAPSTDPSLGAPLQNKNESQLTFFLTQIQNKSLLLLLLPQAQDPRNQPQTFPFRAILRMKMKMTKTPKEAKQRAKKRKMIFKLHGKSLRLPNYCMKVNLNHARARPCRAKAPSKILPLNGR